MCFLHLQPTRGITLEMESRYPHSHLFLNSINTKIFFTLVFPKLGVLAIEWRKIKPRNGPIDVPPKRTVRCLWKIDRMCQIPARFARS